MHDAIAMAAPAVFELLDEIRTHTPGAPWCPVTRPRPATAWYEIYPQFWAAMANGKQPMTYDDYQNMALIYRTALLNIRQGSASHETWDCLATAVNLAILLTEIGYGQEWESVLLAAKEGLERASERHAKGASLRLDGPALAALAETLDVLEAQLEVSTRSEIMEARDTMLVRIERQKVESESAAVGV